LDILIYICEFNGLIWVYVFKHKFTDLRVRDLKYRIKNSKFRSLNRNEYICYFEFNALTLQIREENEKIGLSSSHNLKYSNMKDRIRKIMDAQHMTQKEFAQFTGISEGSLSGVFNERTRPTIQMIEAIHERMPSISVEWIMFGTGPMYLNDNKESNINNENNTGAASSLLDVQTSSTDSQVLSFDAKSPSFDPHATSSSPSLFSASVGQHPSNRGEISQNTGKTLVKYVDKPERKITEIRIFYDDQTWETFVPKR
jgi:transcriptional regulator with XRE-family HTH domain